MINHQMDKCNLLEIITINPIILNPMILNSNRLDINHIITTKIAHIARSHIYFHLMIILLNQTKCLANKPYNNTGRDKDRRDKLHKENINNKAE